MQGASVQRNKVNFLRRSLRGNQDFNFVYLNNPKVACSSIKTALWSQIQNVLPLSIKNEHMIEGSPFEDNPAKLAWAENAYVFSVVRNPFTRIVSAYLDKIKKREIYQWEPFARRHGLPVNETISFDLFIELMATDKPEQCDPHWCPQVLGLLHPEMAPNFVGQLERMDQDFAEILKRVFPERSIPVIRRSVHATGASEGFVPYFADAATEARVRAYYAQDFAIYGYDTDFRNGVGSRIVPTYDAHAHPVFASWAKEFAVVSEPKAIAVEPEEPEIDDATLARRLKWNAANPERLNILLTRYAERIRTGPDFLREAAGLTPPKG
ncbi:MAG: sulfotransferase family protein [Cypionkella sp.]